MDGPQVHWTGEARWLTFAVALLLFVTGIVFVGINVPFAGWNIFLGLLLFGSVASGYIHAPRTVKLVGILMAIRVVFALFAQDAAGVIISATACVALGFAWRDFKRQAANLAADQSEPWHI